MGNKTHRRPTRRAARPSRVSLTVSMVRDSRIRSQAEQQHIKIVTESDVWACTYDNNVNEKTFLRGICMKVRNESKKLRNEKRSNIWHMAHNESVWRDGVNWLSMRLDALRT